MMEYLKRGNEVLLLTDDNEVINLEKAISLKAMVLYEDSCCFRQGIETSSGGYITKENLDANANVLNALSNALVALRS